MFRVRAYRLADDRLLIRGAVSLEIPLTVKQRLGELGRPVDGWPER